MDYSAKKRGQDIRARGFTIVELLVVIVVIGILAGISIVAFTGIQDRARNAQLVAAIDVYDKAIRVYYADHGNYPKISAPGLVFACLGESYPARGMLANNACYGNATSALGVKSVEIDNQLKTVVTPLPDIDYKTIKSGSGTSAIEVRGIIYTTAGVNATLMYFVNEGESCGRGTGTAVAGTEGLIRCAISYDP